MHGVYSVVLSRPVTYEELARLGLTLYGCWPMCTPDALDSCTHYLAVLSVPGRIDSEGMFSLLCAYGPFSFQWLTYYMEG